MSIDGSTPAAVSLAQLGEERWREAGAEIAKRFLIAQIVARPLAQTADLPLGQLAERGPVLARGLLQAIADDRELQRLLTGSPPACGELVRLSAAGDGQAVVSAAETLRGAVWGWLLRCARSDGWEPGAALADRLAYVCAELARCALAALAERPPTPGAPQSQGRFETEPEAQGRAGEPRAEHGLGTTLRLDPGWEFPEEAEELAGEATEMRDWSSARQAQGRGLAGSLSAGGLDGGPYAVLLIEPSDAERLAAATEPGVFDLLLERIGALLAGELRPDDRIAQEGRGRWWLVAPQTDARGARALAARLARAVAAAVGDHGQPLALVVGIAAAPDDGTSAAELAAHAEAELFSARAVGRSLAVQR
ncbi:MAG TPA: diguanylate cyclase [Solirubrobacteraceae bacterium]|nr:diguanylate cyclase [Solirubrobacteraceae bacterium]